MGLYSRIIDLQKLQAAWDKVRQNRPSCGVDQMTYEDFEANRKEELKQLHLELAEHKYEVQPVKMVRLVKEDKLREISLYTMRDKVVQASLAAELTKMYDRGFSRCAYAYRSNRSAIQAVEAIDAETAHSQDKWVCKADISSFFDHVNLKVLREKLAQQIREEDVLELIFLELQARQVDRYGELTAKKEGLYQGSGISPVLSNVYLSEFDRNMESSGVFYVRFSDDILLVSSSKEQLLKSLNQMTGMLEALGLELNERKTFVRPLAEGIDFLGYHFDENGKSIPTKAMAKLETSLEDIWLTQSGKTLEERLKKGSQILNGWEQYYREEREIRNIYEYVVLVYMMRYKEELKAFAERRRSYENAFKDIAKYLAEVWREQECADLEILEYEQYFAIPMTEKSLEECCRQELLQFYREMLIAETTDGWTALMQTYSDAGCYEQAELCMERIQKLKKQPEMRMNLTAPKTDGNTEVHFDHQTAELMMNTLVGREDMYSREVLDADHRRKTEFVPEPVTQEVIRSHLKGEDAVDTFILRGNDTVHYMVIDVDISRKVLLSCGQKVTDSYLTKAIQTTQRIMQELQALGIRSYAEYSGYRGYHIWIFFTEWLPVRYVYSLQELVSQKITLPDDEITIEYLPARGRKKAGSMGMAIKLPYGYHLIGGQRSYFCEKDFAPVSSVNDFLSGLARYSLMNVKKVIAAQISENHPETKQEKAGEVRSVPMPDPEKLGSISDNIRQVLTGCTLMRYLVNKAMTTGYLSHAERLSVLYVFGHLGEEGKEFVHTVMGFTMNYQHYITQKFISRLPAKPVSCIKLREQYKSVTAESGCNCIFKRTKNCYPSPVLHALKKSAEVSSEVTIPISRTLTKEKQQSVYQELNIHVKVQEIAEKIVELKKQKRGIDKSIEKVEKELTLIFDNAQVDCMEISMGMLVRRKKGDTYEWLIEI